MSYFYNWNFFFFFLKTLKEISPSSSSPSYCSSNSSLSSCLSPIRSENVSPKCSTNHTTHLNRNKSIRSNTDETFAMNFCMRKRKLIKSTQNFGEHKKSKMAKQTTEAVNLNANTSTLVDVNDSIRTTSKTESSKSKRIRTIFTPEQLERLEIEFEKQQYMVGNGRLYLASKLNLTEAQVKVWFQVSVCCSLKIYLIIFSSDEIRINLSNFNFYLSNFNIES